MISENAFTEKDKQVLEETPLRSEMAAPGEWIVREDAKPDELLTVYVFVDCHGDLSALCSCWPNAEGQPCPHTLDVINKVRANDEILIHLLKRRNASAAVPATSWC